MKYYLNCSCGHDQHFRFHLSMILMRHIHNAICHGNDPDQQQSWGG